MYLKKKTPHSVLVEAYSELSLPQEDPIYYDYLKSKARFFWIAPFNNNKLNQSALHKTWKALRQAIKETQYSMKRHI